MIQKNTMLSYMNIHLLSFLLLLSLGCNSRAEKQNSLAEHTILNDSALSVKKDTIKKEPSIQSLAQLSLNAKSDNYNLTKQKIAQLRTQARSSALSIDSLSTLFKEALLCKIIPYWEGTEWSFEGHTSVPKTGKIACGYFVSTTLRDMGLQVNRYKLAQQSPINEAKTLALSGQVKEIEADTKPKKIKAISEALKEGIHFIGFDQHHVGFILKEQGELYLIHSNYIENAGVVIEGIENSEVFDHFSKFYLVELSSQAELLKAWVEGNPIEVVQ